MDFYDLDLNDLVLDALDDMNFTEIAYIVGFRDPGYFTKCFRQKYGKTPKEYRNDLSRK